MGTPGKSPTRTIELAPGTIRYTDEGAGPPIVLVHGVLVNGRLWRKVVPPLVAAGFRCIVPDWPLGSHGEPMRVDADLSPPALARLVADFLAALDLDDVTLVGNDTGGALCQMVATRHPERVGRLVLTPSDAFENFPPKLFHYLLWAARVPAVLDVLLRTLAIDLLRRSPLVFGRLAKRRIDPAALESYVRPVLANAGVRRDVAKIARGIDPRFTLEAAERLRAFARPVLLAWAPEDVLFPIAHAHRLAALLPDARVVEIADSWTFVPEDQPARLAALIAEFAAEGAAHRDGAQAPAEEKRWSCSTTS